MKDEDMETDGDESAFAAIAVSPMGDTYNSRGLTKREYFAAMAMQGIWSNPHDIPGKTNSDPVGAAIARVAVAQADALIEALNK